MCSVNKNKNWAIAILGIICIILFVTCIAITGYSTKQCLEKERYKNQLLILEEKYKEKDFELKTKDIIIESIKSLSQEMVIVYHYHHDIQDHIGGVAPYNDQREFFQDLVNDVRFWKQSEYFEKVYKILKLEQPKINSKEIKK